MTVGPTKRLTQTEYRDEPVLKAGQRVKRGGAIANFRLATFLVSILLSISASGGAHASGSFTLDAKCSEDYATVGDTTAGKLHCGVDIGTSDGAPFVEGHSGTVAGFVNVRQGAGGSFRLDALVELRFPGGVLYGHAYRDSGILHRGEGQLRMIGADGEFARIEATCTYSVQQGESLLIAHKCAWRRLGR